MMGMKPTFSLVRSAMCYATPNNKGVPLGRQMPVAQDAVVKLRTDIGPRLKSGESPPLGAHVHCSMRRAKL